MLMSALNGLLDSLRLIVRKGAHFVARVLNRLSGGKLSPDVITFTSLLGHLPIAWLIISQHLVWAAALLVIFGLMDTLDGELARLQKRASHAGMLLDASTDRMKESILYIAIAYLLVHQGHPYGAVWAVAACAGALLVSYVKAKGETAMANSAASHATINHMFQDGLMRYEIRMFVLIVGMLSNQLLIAVIILTVLTWYTATQRLFSIGKYLKEHVST
jgi:CDP-diacylglycerol--glycerol-3-phosphate 3-phosphatidyltransferase